MTASGGRGQLGLFGGAPRAPENPPEPKMVGFYAGPVSPDTGGGLSAVESVRVLRGLSIAIVGRVLQVTDGGYWEERCFGCVKYMATEKFSRPIYQAARESGPVKGQPFQCGRCGARFEGHRDEGEP